MKSLIALDDAVVAMEATGFRIDASYCSAQALRARAIEGDVLGALRESLGRLGVPPLPGVDLVWSSAPQMVRLFHSVLGAAPSPVWKKGRVDVDAGERKLDQVALEWVALRTPQLRPLIASVIQLRRTRGCIKYLEKFPTFIGPDGRVHPTCGPAGDADERSGAVTGRLAIKNPEAQQIPKDPRKDPYQIRRAFVAEPGKVLVVADFSALEVMLLAHICLALFGDDQLARMTAPGAPDIHSWNARLVFGEHLDWKLSDGRRVRDLPLSAFKDHDDPEACRLRDLIKTVWYGLMYGKGGYGFGSSLLDDNGDPIGEDRATEIVEALLNAVLGIRRYQSWVRDYIHVHRGIPSLAGRWCPLGDLLDMRSRSADNRAWRRALNFPMQAGAADVVGAAMVAVHRDPLLRDLGFVTILQVHDELIIEGPAEGAPKARDRLVHLMTNSFPLRVPLAVEAKIATNWHEGK